MKNLNVLFIWNVDIKLQEYLRSGLSDLKKVNLLFPIDLSAKNLHIMAKEADIIVGWRPARELLDSSIKLKLFINPGAGVQHLISLFREVSANRQISLVNGHGNSYFTAQHGMAMLLSLMNKIVLHHNWMREGKWRLGDREASSIPLRKRKVGFLGYGHVNSKIHDMLKGFDVEFAALKNHWEHDHKDLKQFNPSELSAFLKHIDILFCAVPLTSRTTGMIGKPELNLLGSYGLLINLSRGAVINESALYNALKTGTISGAAIDVWYNYQPEPDAEERKYPFNFPFQELENVILSPHRAASPFDDLQRWDEVIENISRFAQGRTDLINLVSLEKEY